MSGHVNTIFRGLSIMIVNLPKYRGPEPGQSKEFPLGYRLPRAGYAPKPTPRQVKVIDERKPSRLLNGRGWSRILDVGGWQEKSFYISTR